MRETQLRARISLDVPVPKDRIVYEYDTGAVGTFDIGHYVRSRYCPTFSNPKPPALLAASFFRHVQSGRSTVELRPQCDNKDGRAIDYLIDIAVDGIFRLWFGK